jgi:hypothetical protein
LFRSVGASKLKEKAMAGTKRGGAKAATTNKSKYGSDFYARIGAAGGKVGRTGGFYANRDLARKAGAMGGRISRRGKSSKPAASTGTSTVAADNS